MAPLLAHAAEIAGQFWRAGSLVLVAEPGAGKTTLLPPALLMHPDAAPGQIWVLEPRRLAARLAATHVAQTLGEAVGDRVGFQVRFAQATSANTRLVYATEGVLLQRLVRDPSLAGIALVLFDEFHERNLAQDAGLAALCALRARGQLRAALGVMSATLDHERVAEILGVAARFVPGRTYPVSVRYAPPAKGPRAGAANALARQVAQALGQVLMQPLDAADQQSGNILVFLPGAHAIRQALQQTAGLAARHGLRCLPLYASLPPAEQQKPFARTDQRTVIFATNVAETSVTLPGVRWIIDTGLAKQASQMPLSGFTQLKVAPISQAAAAQRAGRAGRVAAGACLRLYSAADFQRRPAYEMPEVARLDLTPTLLLLAQLGLLPVHALPWIDSPSAAACAAGLALLRQLGAIDADEEVTPLGRKMAALPLHPRLARFVWAAEALGVGAFACEVAAALDADLLPPPEQERDARLAGAVAISDWTALQHLTRAHPEARRLAQNLRRAVAGRALAAWAPAAANADAPARLLLAALTGFGDRVAKRLPPLGPRPGALPLSLARGKSALLAPQSQARNEPFVLALQAMDGASGPRGGTDGPQVRWAIDVPAAVLLDAPAPWLAANTQHTWDPARGRVMVCESFTYDGLVLMEEQRPETDVARTLPILRQQFWRTIGARPAFAAELGALLARLALAQTIAPELALGTQSECMEHVRAAWDALLATWAEQQAPLHTLPEEALWPAVAEALPPTWGRALRTLVPTHIVLPHGKRLPVAYGAGGPPFVASYLQDFFGLAQGPTLAQGRVPLVVHLWGPNRRALQVTADLHNFWRAHYPKLRPALSRRYPKHAWPLDPTQATPPPPRRR